MTVPGIVRFFCSQCIVRKCTQWTCLSLLWIHVHPRRQRLHNFAALLEQITQVTRVISHFFSVRSPVSDTEGDVSDSDQRKAEGR